jgi:hypothetical protein
LKRAETALVGMPRAAESYGRLERDILERSKIYAGMQGDLVAARLAAITEGGDVRPLDVAPVPKKRSFPKPTITLAAGFGGGLFAGLFMAVLLGMVGGSMHDAQDVERRTGLPAVRFETASPLLVGGPASKTVLVSPINSRAVAKPVAERLAETAISRGLSATVLDLSSAAMQVTGGTQRAALVKPGDSLDAGFNVNAAITRLEATHDLVVVELGGLGTHAAAAAMSQARPVLLVAPERRIERSALQNAVDLLRRVGAPCGGVVLNGDDRRSLRA